MISITEEGRTIRALKSSVSSDEIQNATKRMLSNDAIGFTICLFLIFNMS